MLQPIFCSNQGTAEAPKPADTIIREVASKQNHVELIPVNNWEKSPQRFKVMIDVMKPEKLDSSTQINGLDYLDVPGLTKRDFKLNFYTHKEGNFQIKVWNFLKKPFDLKPFQSALYSDFSPMFLFNPVEVAISCQIQNSTQWQNSRIGLPSCIFTYSFEKEFECYFWNCATFFRKNSFTL